MRAPYAGSAGSTIPGSRMTRNAGNLGLVPYPDTPGKAREKSLRRTNCLFRRFHVGGNLAYAFVPQSLPELQAQMLAVEVALVVEEECLDAALGAAVVWVHADGGGGAPPQGGACIDPMRRHE